MKRILGLWVLALAAAGCGSGIPAQRGAGPAQASAGLDKVGLQVYWEASAKDLRLSGGEQIQAIYRLQDNVYCLTSANRLVALDGLTGVARWAVEVAPPGERVFRPVYAANISLMEKIPGAADLVNPKGTPLPLFDAVVINSATQVVVIDRKTGKVVRRVTLENGASCAGATDGALFYAGTANGWYYAVSLDQALKLWTGSVANSIDQPIECFGGIVYVPSSSGRILAARTGRTRDVLRNKNLGGRPSAPFFVDARGCFAPCSDNSLYAFTADLSQKLWDHPFACKGSLRRTVQVGEKTVFQRAEEDQLYAIDLVSGQSRWGLAEGLQVLACIGTDVYVLATGGRVLQVDEVLGTTKASASLGGLNLFVGNASDPVILAGSGAGRVVCLKPFAAGHVSPRMLKQANK